MKGNARSSFNAMQPAARRVLDWADQNWKWLIFLLWIGLSTYYLAIRSEAIHWFVLGDTDDNIRYLQVRDWLNGQGWYDLRQYRLNPPVGANIHWSRIVDLPLAALMLSFRLFMAPGLADRWACAVAPLLPLLLLMLSLAFIVRRASSGPAWIIAALGVLGAPMGLSMYMPLRIDHHGWQLALIATMLAGIVDPRWVRGGVVAGLASALSVAIGMEMMVYLGGGGALIGLRWIFKQGAKRRMLPYALSLGGGTALCFALFASYANRQPVCDALSPIWVSTLGLGAAGMVVLALLPLDKWPLRLVSGAALGAIVIGFLWHNWPQCLSAYQISPELQRLWLANIKEAKPAMSEPLSKSIPMLALPVAGAIAALIACWVNRRDFERLWAWLTVALMTTFAMALTFWQIRAAPAAQLLAIPAVSWAICAGALALWRARPMARLVGVVVVLIGLGTFNASLVYGWYMQAQAGLSQKTPQPPSPAAIARKERNERIRKANGRCRTLPALEVLNKLPPATIFTLVDLGPRLIATTHHSAIAGPYHRNGDAILDIHHAFDGSPQRFLKIASRHHAKYLLVCPDFPEGTVYQARSPRGFYPQLLRGNVPDWLHPVDLQAASLPYTLYQIDYASAARGEKAPQQRR